MYIKRHSDSEINYFMFFLESQFFFLLLLKKGKKKAGRDHKLYNIREKGEEIRGGIRGEESIVMFGKMER